MKQYRHKEILFGSAYYLEYMPQDRLETDIAMMKKIGMNTVRMAESTWSTLERREGEFDFSFIDRVLEIAEREHLWVVIGTPTYAIPSWLEKKCPEVMVYDGEKRAKYGRRQIMDITNPTFLHHAEIVIRKLMEHVKDHARVIGYQIDNETKHYGVCSERVQARFVEYLKQKFGSVERLNEAFTLNYWSNAIHDWADFPDMAGCINGGLAGEFAAFQRRLVTEYLSWQAAIVREYIGPDQFITHNFDFEWKKFGADIAQDGYSYGVQPDVDHADAAQCLTIAGTDIYHPTQYALTGAEIAYGGDSIRSLKMDNYLLLECQAQAFKYWTPFPGQLRLHAYSHLASGAASVMYWNWHSIHSGYETYWKGLLSHDMEENPTYLEAGIIGEEFARLGKEKLCIRKENRVALVYDNRSLTAFKWFPIDRDVSYNDVIRHMYDSLYEMNVECDVVDLSRLDVSRYDVIITPALYCISEEHILKLKIFVAEGGVLVSSFKSFVADEQTKVYHDRQPHLMTDVFGMSYSQFSEPAGAAVNGKEIRYFMELLKREQAEEIYPYVHQYWGQYSAVTRNVYGKGCAYYIGAYVDKDTLKEVYRQALTDAHLKLSEALFPVILRSGVNEMKELIHYVLHYDSKEGELVCPYEEVIDLLSNERYRKGDKILLRDWDARVLQETNKEEQ